MNPIKNITSAKLKVKSLFVCMLTSLDVVSDENVEDQTVEAIIISNLS
jgi:hypothetical protein